MATDNGKSIPGQDILAGTFEKDKYYQIILYPKLTEEQKTELNDIVFNYTQKEINDYCDILRPLKWTAS